MACYNQASSRLIGIQRQNKKATCNLIWPTQTTKRLVMMYQTMFVHKKVFCTLKPKR